MATKYVWSGATGTVSGDSWTDAYTTLGAAVTAAADVILVHDAHSESLGADATYTLTVNTVILSVDKDDSDALSAGALIGAQATNYSVTINGAFKFFVYGIELRNGTGASDKDIVLNSTDGGHAEFDSCKFTLSGTNGGCVVYTGFANATRNAFTSLKNCTFKFSNVSQFFNPNQVTELIGCSIDAAGSAPTNFMAWDTSGASSSIVEVSGGDFSKCVSNLVGNSGINGSPRVTIRQARLGSGVSILGTPAQILNKGNASVAAYDCSSGDAHYEFYHRDAFGTTVATPIYVEADGAETNEVAISWQITTTANCSYHTPYTTPWIAKAHTGTTAITAAFEGLRVNSTTIIQNDEVWGEWQYKASTGFTNVTTVNDRATMAATISGADQTSAKAFGWNTMFCG